jgi:hypothetical protein
MSKDLKKGSILTSKMEIFCNNFSLLNLHCHLCDCNSYKYCNNFKLQDNYKDQHMSIIRGCVEICDSVNLN